MASTRLSRRERAATSLRKTANFLKVFAHSRRGILGVATLVFFISVALASDLIAPYDPVNDWYVSGELDPPIWLVKIVNAPHSENQLLFADPTLNTPTIMDKWQFQVDENTTYSYANYIGDPGTSLITTNLPGSIALSFLNQTRPVVANISLSTTFNYPYSGPPKKTQLDISTLANKIENTPMTIEAFIEKDTLETKILSSTSNQTSTGWLHQSTVLQPLASSKLFTSTGIYTLTITVQVDCTKNQNSESTIYLDNINLKLYGTAFGLLGTDAQGRDIFSQLVNGSRISLIVGLLSAFLSVGLGLIVGLMAGYLGKAMDELLMRFTDLLLVLPGLPLLLVLIAVLGPSLWNIILLIGVLGWMGFSRTVRSMVLSLKERPFIESARAVGASKMYIMLIHVIPNVMSVVYVTLALSVPGAILQEAALSFLGLFDPRVMSWGRMLHDAEQQITGATCWWWVIPPGLSIALVSLSFVMLGYALDEILNPKLRIRK